MPSSPDLDKQTLALVARLIETHSQDALLVQKLWHDRETLIGSMRAIEGWDTAHSEALSVVRAIKIAEEALRSVGEE